MNNIANEEKFLKKYLKKKMFFNQESVVKFLITGIIGVTITACGGGGGGGSSSEPSIPVPIPPIEKPPIDPDAPITITENLENKGHELTGGNYVIAGTVSGNKIGLVGIYAINTNVENRATINLTGENSIGIDGAYSEIINGENGIIRVSSVNSFGIDGFRTEIVNRGEIIAIGDLSIGIRAVGGKVENYGDITVTGDGAFGKYGGTGIVIEANQNDDGVVTYTNSLNAGKIQVVGDYTKGISIEQNDFTNTGIIDVKGRSSTGISVSNNTPINSAYYKFAKIENEGTIDVSGNATITKAGENYYRSNNAGIGIDAKQTNVYNSGDIYAKGDGATFNHLDYLGHNNQVVASAATGIKVTGAEEVINKGNIVVSGKGYVSDHVTGPYGQITYGPTGIDANGGFQINTEIRNEGTIDVTGDYAIGIRTQGSNYSANEKSYVNVKNVGDIIVSGKNSVGIRAIQNSDVSNFGKIEVEGLSARGIYTSGKSSSAQSIGIINVDGPISYGMYADDESTVTNSQGGVINIYGENSYGMGANAKSLANNRGVINNHGKNSYGMYAYDGSTVTNSKGGVINAGVGSRGGMYARANGIATNIGTIEVVGNNAYGMYADDKSLVINEKDGVINVGASALGGMYAASGGTAINRGTINIEAGNVNADNMIVDGNEESVSKAAMMTDGGTIENYGKIITNGEFSIDTSNGGSFVIGTSEDGSFGKISAKNASLDGDIKVSANITKNGFKNDYTMQNIVNAEEITYGDSFNFISTSLLYDAEAVTDRWGNLDGKLARNDSTLSDFTTGHQTAVADVFGKYQNEEGFKTLSSDAQTVLKSIDTESVESIRTTLGGLTPSLYANLSSQIFNTGDTFNSQGIDTINSLGKESFNFSLIGNYSDMDSKNGVEGYESKLTGFVGAMDLGDGIFGTVGYGYSKVDYDSSSEGKIQTIHAGINKLAKINEFDYRLGLSGEYNFHENTRKISTLGRTAESDFDSYRVGAIGEISKKYGEETYVKPFASLEVAYGKYDSIAETGANSANTKIESQDYTSVLPKAGVKIGKTIDKVSLFASVDYSYELGDMEKTQKFSFEGFEGTAYLSKNEMENGKTTTKVGVEYKGERFNFSINAGKEFGKRENSFVGAGVGYKF